MLASAFHCVPVKRIHGSGDRRHSRDAGSRDYVGTARVPINTRLKARVVQSGGNPATCVSLPVSSKKKKKKSPKKKKSFSKKTKRKTAGASDHRTVGIHARDLHVIRA